MSYSYFGRLEDGREVDAYRLVNDLGMEVTILNYGGIIQSMIVPTSTGRRQVVLGYASLDDYEVNPSYLGATIGRSAGRIAKGQLTIDEKCYRLHEDNKVLLHGGQYGFHQQLMDAHFVDIPFGQQLRLYFVAKEQIDGFPGDVEIEIVYQLLRRENTLKVTYWGFSHEKTYLNMTNHSYFNLSQDGKTSVGAHSLSINADRYAPIDNLSIPKPWVSVEDTPMDFRKPKRVDITLESLDEQIETANGVDHPFALDRCENVHGLVLGATLLSPDERLRLEVYTTQEHIVVYSGNFLDVGEVPSGQQFKKNQGICFETQEKPNLVNENPNRCFWTVPGAPYHEEIKYVFHSL